MHVTVEANWTAKVMHVNRSQQFEGKLQLSCFHSGSGDNAVASQKNFPWNQIQEKASIFFLWFETLLLQKPEGKTPREQHRVNWASACYFRSHVSWLPSGAAALSCAVLWRAAAIEGGMLSPCHRNFDVLCHLRGAPFTHRVVHLHPAPFQTQHSNVVFFTEQSNCGFIWPCCGTFLSYWWCHVWLFGGWLVALSTLCW